MGFYPEQSPPRTDISCDTCVAACCRKGTMISMTPNEVTVNLLKIKRDVVRPATPYAQTIPIPASEHYPEPFEVVIPANTEVSILAEDCGHITPENRCAIYTSPHRPTACEAMQVGSEACMFLREQAGIVDPPRS